jgi:hypothetical protein
MSSNSHLWCTTDQSIISTVWAPNNPKSGDSERCVNLKVNKSPRKVELTSKNCTNMFVFGCQVYNCDLHYVTQIF